MLIKISHLQGRKELFLLSLWKKFYLYLSDSAEIRLKRFIMKIHYQKIKYLIKILGGAGFNFIFIFRN